MGRLLTTGLGFKVTGQCGSVPEALDILKREPADVVLLDLDLGKHVIQGFVRTAERQGFKGKILILATEVDQDDAGDLIRAGVCGIFQKCDPGAMLAHGIRDVVAGNVWFKHAQLQSALACESERPPNARNGSLTRRERSVLLLVSEGFTNREIGTQLGVSEGSVKAALQQLFSKFGVRSRSRLVRIVWEHQKQRP